MSISHAHIFSNMACHNKYMAKHSIKTEASERLQEIVTKNIRVRLALYNVKQTTLAEALLQTQAGLSAKINRKSEWTVADIANAAAFFHEPVENLITSSTLDAISGSSEYQLEHNVPVDISRRELSAPAGARYLRKPDENEDRPHGAVGPRAFVMPLDVDQMNLGPRFSARTRFRLPHPQLDINPSTQKARDHQTSPFRTRMQCQSQQVFKINDMHPTTGMETACFPSEPTLCINQLQARATTIIAHHP